MDDIKLPDNLDEFIDKCVDNVWMEENKNMKRKSKRIGITAAGFVLGVTLIGINNPVLAAKIPVIGGIFELFDANNGTEFNSNSTTINEVAKDKGYTVTMSKIACDKENLYVEYVIENEKKFENIQIGKVVEFLISDDLSILVNGEEKVLDGYTTIKGYFEDENTFIGLGAYSVGSYKLKEGSEVKFKSDISAIPIGYIEDRDGNNMIGGKWSLTANVKVANMKLEEREVQGKITNGYSINKIEESPYKLYVEIKTDKKYYPNEKEENVNMDTNDIFWLNFVDKKDEFFLGVRGSENIKAEDGSLIVRYEIDKTLIPKEMKELEVFIEDNIKLVDHDCSKHEEDSLCDGNDSDPQRRFKLEEKIVLK